MTRATCVAVALFVGAAAVLPAQSRNRDRDFGLSDSSWCREAREADHCEVREETLRNVSAIDLDARGNGGVSIRGWDRDDAQVRVRVTTMARSDDEARDLARDVQLVVSGTTIRVDGPRNRDRDRGWRDREWWAASFELQVPRRSRLTVNATNGGIVIDDVRGSVDAETTNGGLVFQDVSGDVRGRAVNGGVVVDLSGDRWQGAGLDVRTTNGGIRMTLPANYSAELEARATNGGIAVDFPLTVQGLINSRREIRATIGSGGAPLRVATTNGGVRISRR